MKFSSAASQPENSDDRSVRVALVGAGPGDPGLITVRGLECLRRADVVLYDYLANAQLLEVCSPQAVLVCLGKHGRDRLLSQDEVNARMVAEAKAGRFVVRLKGGDPAVFARYGEESAALEAAGLRYEVVPGITTALAAGSHAGIAITDRRVASAVALVTGHEQDDDAESSKIDYAALARFPGTLVFYMGLTNAKLWASALIAAGKSPHTPTAVVRRCSWPDQTTLVTTLGELADRIVAAKLRPPVIVVVGDVVGLRNSTSWFTERPLFGRTIVVTRPAEQSGELRDRLQELGAEVLMQPAIAIDRPDDLRPLDAALNSLDRFDWLVFSSANGVEAVVRRLDELGRDLRALGPVRLAAIGSATAEKLAEYRLRADLVPGEFRAEALAAALIDEIPRGRRKFLLVRASRGREVLAQTLRAAGGEVEQAVAYRSTDVAQPDPAIAARLAAGEVDWMTVTSSAIARSLVALFGESLRKTKLASISPITSATLRELGHEPSAEAEQYTLAGVVQAVLHAERRKNDSVDCKPSAGTR